MTKLEFAFIRKYEKDRVIIDHSHNCHELIYYIKAKGCSTYNQDRNIFFHDSMFVLCPPNIVHNEKHIGQSTVLAIGYNTEDPSLIFDNVMECNDIEIIKLFENIRYEIAHKEYNYNKAIEYYIAIILTFLKRFVKADKQEVPIVHYIIKYIDEYYRTPINTKDLAYIANYSPDHLRVLFKKETGVSPKEYILQKRLGHAIKLLETTNMSVNQISLECGFEYASHFIKFLKQKTNLTPKEIRKNSLNNFF